MAVDWVRLKLDLDAFDRERFEPVLRRCRRDGITFTTMAQAGDTPRHRRALYELNKTCSADIPGRGPFHTYEEYLAERVETPLYDPRGVVLAVDGGTWAGMAATTLRPEGHAFSEMTGVLRSHRGRGIAVAMKVLAADFARAAGARELRTLHQPGNAPVIALNRRLGFTDDVPAGAGA
ncbi:GNAT family N-acetyltransferase [Streptomyces longispororuber]|uniref:GNAT family N-acetyltransferase n=1 Tax=Streptomyces longispororuber TaxID=68230 RepID=UPI0036F9BEDC